MSDLNTPQAETGLAEELESFVNYQHATQGQRFVNFLIDNLLMRFGLSWVTGALIGLLLQGIAPEFLAEIAYGENKFDLFLLSYIIGIFNYLLYYTICEKAFKGYTLGKLISGTRAIRDDGDELTFKDALLRSLSRLVPFEVFSGFGTPWHDSWTKTSVIKAR
jgi:uncharacterized RDD family membrane protein YckC